MDEHRNENNTNKWIISGCVLLVVFIACCSTAIVGGLIWLGSLSTDGKAQINVTAPTSVEQGQAYAITVEIVNITEQSIMLDSVDISSELLRGFIIQNVEPFYIETYEYGLGEERYQTYAFQTTIPAGGRLTVKFEGEAVALGDFSGEIDVCIDSSFNCKTDIVRMLVR